MTGATGLVGRRLLRRLIATNVEVRCLVRDPGRMGPERARAQVALGDLGDYRSFPAAVRGVDTVVHLAASIRDQPQGSIEELSATATERLVEAAERAGVRRFVFFSTLSATTRSPVRFMRAKALAERAVVESGLEQTVFAPSIIYAPDDPYLKLLRRMSCLPVMAIPGSGDAQFEPIWAEDVVDCVMAVLPGDGEEANSVGIRYELAGPEILTHRQIVATALASFHRRRRIVEIPRPVTRAGLKAVELVQGSKAFATWDEAELLEVPLVSRDGIADAQILGVSPRPMAAVLGATSLRGPD